ncbi:MAG: ComEC/Rec2 family competence protein [Sedimentisphaerales bacterium]|nr:ComEC/Rec2 family competence protein [Sedimentisphaerales bacterium]
MDEIRRKLDGIDEQLAGRNAASRLIRTAPLLLPALGLMAGILLQDRLTMAHRETSAPLRAWVVLLALAAAGTWAYCVCRRRHSRPGVLACGATFCFLCLGAIRLLAFTTPAADDVRHLVGAQRRLATVRGYICTEPRVEQRDWAFARFSHADPSTSFYLMLGQVKTGRGWRRTRGTIRVHVGEPAPGLHVGDCIEASCWLHRFEGPTNPGQFNVAEYLGRRNVRVGASVASKDSVTLGQEGPAGILTRLRRILGRAAAQALLDHAPADTPSEGLLEALLLGYRGHIDRRTYEAFRRTGLLHLISLSGMHLGILAGLVWWLGKTLGLLKPARALVCMAATVIFLLVVPPRPPTIRAAIIVLVYCLSILLRRRASPLNSLSLAAIVLLLLRPTNLFEAGWQLSFAAVAGILSLTGGIERVLEDRIASRLDKFDRLPHAVTRPLQRMARAAIRLFAAGFAAWLGGAGILGYHFYTVTPLAGVWTVLVFPFVAAILILGFAKLALFFFLPTLSTLLGSLVCLLADLLIAIVRLLAELDCTQMLIGHVTLYPIVLYYTLVFIAAFVRIRRPLWKTGVCAALALVLFASLGLAKWRRTHRSGLSLTCLDVGHGQAILAQLPGSTNILFDAGSLYKTDVGTRIVLPYLDYAGLGRLRAVVISHHDVDHINGIPEIAGGRRVEHVYATTPFLAQTRADGAARFLADCLRQETLTIERVPETLTLGPARITTLWPPPGVASNPKLGDNDGSLVTLIEFAGVKILLCSDIEQFAQEQILGLYPDLGADVVVVPHHGSVSSLRPEFLRKLRPRVLLCSCSKPVQAGQAALCHDTGAVLRCTATNGAITVCVDTRGMIETTPYIVQDGD